MPERRSEAPRPRASAAGRGRRRARAASCRRRPGAPPEAARSGRTSPRRGTSAGSGSGRSRRTRRPFSVYAPQAAIGAANATPTSTATGIARTPSGEFTAPNAAITTRYTVAVISMRNAMKAWCPSRTSPTRSGRREHRVVLPAPLDGREHWPARLERCDLHRGRGEEPGRDELEVGDAVGRSALSSTSVPEPEAEREQEDHRRHDARDGRPAPDAPVLGEEELERPNGERVASSLDQASGR